MTSPTVTRRRFFTVAAVLAGAAASLVACSSSDPLATTTASSTAAASESATAEIIHVGSQQYYSNEIIAELYAQALEAEGFTVAREFQIGQREIYMPELNSGAIDVFPEYTGNLLQYLDPDATDPEDVPAALATALPEGLEVLEPADAADQDSYTVTREAATEFNLVSIADLASLEQPISVAANSELATRPYGPEGLLELYGVEATVTGVEDSGGPLTLKALLDGVVDAADIYTSDPAIAANDLVVLDDPEGLILEQRVIPVVTSTLSPEAREVIEAVQAKLSMEALRELNSRSVNEQLSAEVIATDWLTEQGLR